MSLQDSLARISAGTHSQGHQQDVEDAVVNTYKQMFGREPSQNEFAQALPAFDTSANAGQAYLAQAQSAQQNSPEGQQATALAKYNSNPDQWNSQVNNSFKTNLGRDATAAEQQHFGSLLANGTIDPYGLTQFVQGTPEYGQTQDKNFQDSQKTGLQKQNADYYTNTLLPQIQSTLAGQGRSLDSSTYTAMMAQAAKQQEDSMNQYMTGLSATQYAGRTGQAQTDYGSYLASLKNNQDRNYQLQDALTGQQNQFTGYNAQRDAYNQYLSQYGKRKGNVAGGAVSGGVAGASAGAAFGPWGAGIGGLLGAGLGAYGQSQNS